MTQPGAWWSDRRYLAILVLMTAVPLLWPALPPLTDALGHLARYHIELAVDRSPALARYYSFHWQPIGNLGVDLLIVPLAKLVGVEPALKLVAIAIPVLTVIGLILVAGQVHGRAPPMLGFALPLAYGWPFQFGFLNYTLAMALALLAFALWIRMGRSKHIRLRGGCFVVIGAVLWTCHVFGWAVLALMIVAWEWAGSEQPAERLARRLGDALVATLPLASPLILMALWRSGAAAGDTGDWFDLGAKLSWTIAVLRDRWEVFDRISAALLLFIAIAGLVERKLGYARRLGWVAAALALAFLCLPRILLGSAYADMRLAPDALAIALIAIRPPSSARWARWLAAGALVFFLVRTAATTVGFAWYDRDYRRQLAAIDHLPRNARLIAFVGTPCQTEWSGPRMEHLGGLATVRRDAFVNDQWALPGAQLLHVYYPAAGLFAVDPSQIVRPAGCGQPGEPPHAGAIPDFPREAFDYLWLINMPEEAAGADPHLHRVWATTNGALFKIAPGQ